MIRTYSEHVESDTSNPFMKIFWDQQLKAATLTSTWQISRHHSVVPVLNLHNRSSGCNKTLCNSGIFHLASKRTYVHFPASSTKGPELFPILQKVISRLTRLGLEVLTVTCDVTSENRLLISLHNEKNDKTAYKIKNIYSKTSSSIFSYQTQVT